MSYYQIETGASTDQSFRARQAARAARRQRVAEKEAKRQKVVDAVKFAAQVIVGAFFLYMLMFLACL